MIGALCQVTLRQWRRHTLRAALATASIALGVAAFYAIITANLGVNEALRLTVERIAGRATLQVTAGESGVGEEILERVRAVPGVAMAAPVIEVVAPAPFADAGNLLVLGLDVAGDNPLHGLAAARTAAGSWQSLEFIALPDSIAVSAPFAARYRLSVGSRLTLTWPSGARTFTVRGLFEPAGLAEVYGGQVAVVDVFAAQDLFARGRAFDRIDLANDPATDVDTLRARLRAALPAGLEVERPAARGRQLEDTVAVMQFGFQVSSAVALLVAVYIILNAFTIAVAQRRREIGILRALGVTRRGITGMLLGEAAVTGTVGALLGIVTGQSLAEHAARLMGTVAASAFGVVTTTPVTAWRPDYALAALALGIVAAALGAWLPARAAARLDPAQALHDVEIRVAESGLGAARFVAGLVMLAASATVIAVSSPRVGLARQLAPAALLLAGAACVLPALAHHSARLLRPLLDRLAGATGAIAVDAIIAAPRRNAATVAALVIGMTFVFTTGATIEGYQRLVHDWMERVINADLIVASSSNARSVSGHFREELGRQIGAVPGIAAAESIRYTTTAYRGARTALVATDMAPFLHRTAAALAAAPSPDARQRLVDGRAALVSRSFATRWGLGPGGTLDLDSPSGPVRLDIAGLIDDYRSDTGSIFISRTTYRQRWRDGALDFVDIRLVPGADAAVVRRAVTTLVAAAGNGIVYANAEYRRHVGALIDRYFLLNDVQLIIAVAVALLGIVNTLVVSVTERRREIGVLRALGALRSQVRDQILVEAAVIAVLGVLIGAALSALATLFISRAVAAAVAGYVLPYVVPWPLLLPSLPVAVAVAVLAGWWPARRAGHGAIVAAIASE